MLREKLRQPVDAGIIFEGVTEAARLSRLFRTRLAGDASELAEIILGDRCGMKFATRESSHGGACIVEYNSAGSVLIQERSSQSFSRSRASLRQRIQVLVEADWVPVKN